MSNKFKKPEANNLMNPVDFFNFHGSFIEIFNNPKIFHPKSETEVCIINLPNLTEQEKNEPSFKLNKDNTVSILKNTPYELEKGQIVSKFMLLCAIRFKGDFYQGMSYIEFELKKNDIPYLRIGTDYFKLIQKKNRFNAIITYIKPWKKEEIKQDHGKKLLSYIPKFDDFTIYPNNIEYTPTINNCFNLYSKFPHEPYQGEVYHEDIPVSIQLITHIFGDQWYLGMQYMKLLYEYPQQILPVLVLVSTERETGKTTFLNWITMLFGENATLINPGDLMSSFNDGYATKNIIMIDETVIDKAHTIEKLKSIATAKTMSVSQKFVSHYSVPFFGKVIICTNKETDFMRIDEEEIRFWVRKINTIDGKKNTNIESDLFDEIPKFLKYLQMMPDIDFSRSRMVFTMDEIKTISLESVKEESKSWLRKDLEMLIEDYFLNNPTVKSIEMTAKDIRDTWFLRNNQVNLGYIRKVLKDEMKINLSKEPKRYKSINDNYLLSKVGRVYEFVNNQAVEEISIDEEETSPF